MPKLTKKYYTQNGNTLEYIIKVDTKGRFSVKIPENIATANQLRQDTIYSAKMDELEKEFRRLASNYFSREKKVRKIIAYQVRYDHPNFTDKRGEFHEGTAGSPSFSPDYGFSAEYHIWQEVTRQGKKSWYLEDATEEDINGTSGRVHCGLVLGYDPAEGYVIIDYTPELEKWFEKMIEGLQEMIVTAQAFFGHSGEELIENIQKNGYFLGTGEKEGDQK